MRGYQKLAIDDNDQFCWLAPFDICADRCNPESSNCAAPSSVRVNTAHNGFKGGDTVAGTGFLRSSKDIDIRSISIGLFGLRIINATIQSRTLNSRKPLLWSHKILFKSPNTLHLGRS